MTATPKSTPAVVEHLIREFDGTLSARVVTDVVLRLSANGSMSLPVLAERARKELTARIGADTEISSG